MKSIKLSLVAALAAGSLAVSAGAVSLADAISDVSVSGYARGRYENQPSETNGAKSSSAQYRFSTEADAKFGFGDNFYGVIGFIYDSFEVSGADAFASTAKYSLDNRGTQSSFDVRHYYLGYKVGNTEITFGRQKLGTFFTDDMAGTGLKVVNGDIPGLTLAAIAFDNLEYDSDGKALKATVGNTNSYVGQNNLYGVAAIGSYAPVDFQVWVAGLQHVLKYAVAAEVKGTINAGDVAKVTLRAQGVTNKASDGAAAVGGTDSAGQLGDSTFYGVEAKANFGFGLDVKLGYVDFSTDKDKAGVITIEDAGGLINTGFQLLAGRKGKSGYTLFDGENNYFLGEVGYSFLNKFRFSLEYVTGSNAQSDTVEYDGQEILARLNYNHNKKLSFQTFYSKFEWERSKGGTDKYTNDWFRVQAMYRF